MKRPKPKTKSKTGFTRPEVSQMTGLSIRQLDHLCEKGIVVPTAKRPTGPGTHGLYRFADVIEARVVHDLQCQGFPRKRCAAVLKELRRYKRPWGDVRLIISGRDVTFLDKEQLISVLKNPGQTFLPFFTPSLCVTVLDLGAATAKLQKEVTKRLKRAA